MAQKPLLARLRDIRTDSPQALKDTLERLQAAVQASLSGLFAASPLMDGRLVAYTNGADDQGSGPTLEASRRGGTLDLSVVKLAVPHGLGRPYRGWLVVRQSADSTIYEPYRPGASELTGDLDPSRVVVLVASQPVTVTLWVF